MAGMLTPILAVIIWSVVYNETASYRADLGNLGVHWAPIAMTLLALAGLAVNLVLLIPLTIWARWHDGAPSPPTQILLSATAAGILVTVFGRFGFGVVGDPDGFPDGPWTFAALPVAGRVAATPTLVMLWLPYWRARVST